MEQVKLTQNEWQIVQAIRGMNPLDQLWIVKKSPKSEQEFELRPQQVTFLFKNG